MKVLSPTKKRRAVFRVMEQFDVFEQRSCRALSQPRSAQHYLPRVRNGEELLTERMIELANQVRSLWLPQNNPFIAKVPQ
jgi:hypothetical protein